jgi:D-glycero-beta-D-manno-heptose-7-phosphate kinase
MVEGRCLQPFLFKPLMNITDRFAGKTVVILGDPVADQFLHGRISRVSREAPVFILKHDTTVTVPGAAANAAANVASLGGTSALVGLIGVDANGTALAERLAAAGVDTNGLVSVHGMITTTKVRVLAAQSYAPRQQVIRIDYESDHGAAERTSELIEKLTDAVTAADALVVSDYGCGTVSMRIFEEARKLATDRGIPLIVDSRSRLSDFYGATTATPNREEVEAILGSRFTDADCAALCERLGLKALLVTNGDEGMTLFETGAAPVLIPAVGSREPVDVTGAGDTVIAAYALGLASGMSFAEAARVANQAGGLVVMKKGTATVSAAELEGSVGQASSRGAE